jgi:hypothetical protein
MEGETKERWRILCEQVLHERHHKKLIEMVREINEILEAEERRLATQHQNAAGLFTRSQHLKEPEDGA